MYSPRASSSSVPINEAVHIDSLSHDGRGLARYRGKTLFVDGGLPGETVNLQVIDVKRRFANTKVRTVLSASEERCEPLCKHFHQCGGCSLQYWHHDGQLKGKERIALDQLERFAHITPETVSPPLTSDAYGYRYRCRLAIRWKKGQLLLGFREKSSQTICAITECPVLAEPLQSLPNALRTLLPTLKAKEAISHAECFLTEGEQRSGLLRTLRSLPDSDLEALNIWSTSESVQLFLQDNQGHVTTLDRLPVTDALHYPLPAHNLSLAFQPQDFTQVNWPLNQQMIHRALEWLDPQPSDRVLDLFCGLGNFSLPIAQRAAFVTGIEGSESSVARAEENAERNGLSNTAFHAVDLSKNLEQEPWAKQSYDSVLLDPPRTGAYELLQQMAKQLPKKVLYISCNPATLARDAGVLAEHGFHLARFSVMDMFPQTAHVESMALFTRS